MCVILIKRLLRLVGRWARKPVNHTSWVAVVTPTDRPKSVRNRCLIELFCGVVCVVTLPFWHFCWCKGFCHRTESDLFLFLLFLIRAAYDFHESPKSYEVLTNRFNLEVCLKNNTYCVWIFKCEKDSIVNPCARKLITFVKFEIPLYDNVQLVVLLRNSFSSVYTFPQILQHPPDQWLKTLECDPRFVWAFVCRTTYKTTATKCTFCKIISTSGNYTDESKHRNGTQEFLG